MHIHVRENNSINMGTVPIIFSYLLVVINTVLPTNLLSFIRITNVGEIIKNSEVCVKVASF